jgi:hypothetical protein
VQAARHKLHSDWLLHCHVQPASSYVRCRRLNNINELVEKPCLSLRTFDLKKPWIVMNCGNTDFIFKVLRRIQFQIVMGNSIILHTSSTYLIYVYGLSSLRGPGFVLTGGHKMRPIPNSVTNIEAPTA